MEDEDVQEEEEVDVAVEDAGVEDDDEGYSFTQGEAEEEGEPEEEQIDMAVGDEDVEDEDEGYSFTPDSEPPPVASE